MACRVKLTLFSYGFACLHGVLLAVLLITTGNLIGQIHLDSILFCELCQTGGGFGSGLERFHNGIGIADKRIFGLLGVGYLQPQFLKCLFVVLNPLGFGMSR